jgi:hypothetical protein
MTRAEHLAWCKRRALEYVTAGDLEQAMASMASDLGKHPDTMHHVRDTCPLGMSLYLNGHLSAPEKMRKWIEGFN